MSVASALASGRRAAEARMLDRGDLKRPTGRTAQDETTGHKEPIYEVIKTNVRCRVKVSEGLTARDSDAGGRTAVEVTRQLHISVREPKVLPNDIFVMTKVHSTSDQTLTGATLVLSGPAPGSQTTSRRLQVSEVLS